MSRTDYTNWANLRGHDLQCRAIRSGTLRIATLLFVAAGLLLTIPSVNASQCDIENSFFDRAIVQIEQGGKFSTAVIVDENRLLTVAHAIDWQQPTDITANIRGRYVEASPLLVYENTDLALLSADTGNVNPIPLADSDLTVDEEIWVSGFPRGNAQTIEAGAVAAIRARSIVTSATVFPGVSGGGLLRCDSSTGDYQLAGIVTSYLASVEDSGLRNTGNSVSLRIGYIKHLMESSSRQLAEKDGSNSPVPSRLAHSSSHTKL